MKVKEMLDILQEANPEAEVVFNLDDDCYNDEGLEISEILKSLDNSGDIHIIF